MPEITFIDNDDALKEHTEVVQYIRQYHRQYVPDANIKVYVNKKFNPMEPLEWSMVTTSPKGRKHLTVEQRHAGGNIRLSFG